MRVPQVMFLSAVLACPRWCAQRRNQRFSGKIRLHQFADQVPAAQASCNRLQGTLEWRNKSATLDVCAEHPLEWAVPDIVDKWPRDGDLWIQLEQDNALSQVSPEALREEQLLWKAVPVTAAAQQIGCPS